MNLGRTSLLSVALAVASSLFGTVPARACSGPLCPRLVRLALGDDATVPINLRTLTIYTTELELRGSYSYHVVVRRLADGGEPSEPLIDDTASEGALPLAPGLLEEGLRYAIAVTPICQTGGDGMVQTFEVRAGAAVQAPTALGPLKAVKLARQQVPVGGGPTCYQWQDARLFGGRLDDAVAANPYLDHFQLMVDGEPFRWTQTIGGFRAPGFEGSSFYYSQPQELQAWVGCSEGPFGSAPGSLAPGRHEVWVRASTALDASRLLESDRLTVDFSCAADSPQGPLPVDPTGDHDGCSASHEGPRRLLDGVLVALALLAARRRQPRADLRGAPAGALPYRSPGTGEDSV